MLEGGSHLTDDELRAVLYRFYRDGDRQKLPVDSWVMQVARAVASKARKKALSAAREGE